MFVEKKTEGHAAGLQMINEARIFEGQSNPVLFTQRVVTTFHCDLYLHYYPFDTQNCYVQVSSNLNSISNKYLSSSQHANELLQVVLPPKLLNYMVLKPGVVTHLKGYRQKKFEVSEVTLASFDNGTEIRMMMELRRKSEGFILSVFIPTLCLIIAAEITLFVDPSHFEATIMVALTTNLVTYTIYGRLL